MSTVLAPFSSRATVRMALSASLHIMSDHRETNLVPIAVLIRRSISSSLLGSTGTEIESMMRSASSSARLNAEMMTTGWMLRSRYGSACARISPAASGARRGSAIRPRELRGNVHEAKSMREWESLRAEGSERGRGRREEGGGGRRDTRRNEELTQDDDARRAVADLLVLRPRQLDHALGRRVRDLDLAQDGVAVVGEAAARCGVSLSSGSTKLD